MVVKTFAPTTPDYITWERSSRSATLNTTFGLYAIFHRPWPWDMHVYGLSTVWLSLAVFSFILTLNFRPNAPCKKIVCDLTFCLCTAALARVAYLIIDPYDLKKLNGSSEAQSSTAPLVGCLLFALGSTLLTSCFTFIFLAVGHLTSIGPKRPLILCNGIFTTGLVCGHMVIACTLSVTKTLITSSSSLLIHTLLCILFYAAPFLVASTFLYHALMAFRHAATRHHRSSTTLLDSKKRRRSSAHSTKKRYSWLKSGLGVETYAVDYCPPTIRITDENECSYSYRSDNVSESGYTETLAEAAASATNAHPATSINNKKLVNGKRKSRRPSVNGRLLAAGKKAIGLNSRNGEQRLGSSSGTPANFEPRANRLLRLVRLAFLIAVADIFLIILLVWEDVFTTFYAKPWPPSGKWKWFSVVSIARITELVYAFILAIILRRGFYCL